VPGSRAIGPNLDLAVGRLVPDGSAPKSRWSLVVGRWSLESCVERVNKTRSAR
jgi:hypothetical protein